MVTRTPECQCLHCGAKMNAAGSIEGHNSPSPGSLALCIRCGAVMMYAEDLTLRGMTEEEMLDIASDVETVQFLARQVQKIRMLPKRN